MNRYQCHKIVEAAKILAIERLDDDYVQFELDDHEILQKDDQWLHKLPAFVGRRLTGDDLGYFVRYADGYESWSPTTAFEAGYTLIEGDEAAPSDRAVLEDLLLALATSHQPFHWDTKIRTVLERAEVQIGGRARLGELVKEQEASA